MRIVAVDDMPTPRKALQLAIREARPDADVTMCASAEEVLAVDDLDNCDVVFADIDMPGMGGIELAHELKRLHPRINVVFVTGFSDYMADAFALHSSGYVMKPVTADKISLELENLRFRPAEARLPERLAVRCFGDFEVFAHGEPVPFKRAKAKELLAYLVDRRGATCTVADVEAVLWDDFGDGKSRQSYIRSLLHDVRTALDEVGCGDVIVKRRGVVGICPDAINCDYYDYLAGNPIAINAYQGEYMRQYSWAELTHAQLG